MPRTRVHLVVAAIPVAAYLALLLLVAILVRPPLLGWIGLAVVGAVGIALAVAAAVLFPRMRANVAPATRPREGVLVVADATCPSDRLCDAIGDHLRGRPLPVHVVAPVLASPLHYLSGDESAEHDASRARLEQTLERLGRAGIAAGGSTGTDDPLQAIGDALAEFPATELVIVTSRATHWLEQDLPRKAAPLVATVDLVVVDEEPATVTA